MTTAAALETELRFGGAHLRLVVNRPKPNLISAEVIAALRQALAGLRERRGVKLVTIEGAGDHFSYGASVEEHAPSVIDRMLPEMHAVIRDLLAAPAPTAAVVRGRCLGGGFELALACDLVFAADDAVLGVPEIALGVFPPAASALLPLRVGTSRAAAAVLTGEARPAAEWRTAGLVALTAPAATLQAEVDRWFTTHLAGRSAAALGHAAVATRAATRRLVEPLLDELERLYLQDLMRTHDGVEGIAAFMAKRPPRWKDE